MNLVNKEPIELRVSGPRLNQEISIYMPWDADLDDWRTVFKCILLHQTFAEQTISEFFFNEDTDTRDDMRSPYED